jgi:crotonobetainyl-CoA:carnitine CoA-transferase CaiB-like acyl-CoA transferase
VYHQIAVCDFITGLMTAYGVVAALYVRERVGRGQQVETSLANNAMAAQAGEFIRYEGRPPDPPGGRDVDGVSALYRVYRCSDGWLFLAVRTPGQAGALLRATAGALTSSDRRHARSLLKAPPRGDVASALESFFAARTRSEAIRSLTERRIPCAPCLTAKDLFEDEHLKANDLWWEMEHPLHGPMRQTGRIVKWGRRSMRLERPAPLLGQHSREVLLEFGVEPARVEDLIEKGVALAP